MIRYSSKNFSKSVIFFKFYYRILAIFISALFLILLMPIFLLVAMLAILPIFLEDFYGLLLFMASIFCILPNTLFNLSNFPLFLLFLISSFSLLKADYFLLFINFKLYFLYYFLFIPCTALLILLS